MKMNCILTTAAVVWALTATALGQSSNVHQFAAVTSGVDHTIVLTLTSSVPGGFRNYYDLFPIEASLDFIYWQPLATVLRTNKATNDPIYVDSDAAKFNQRFYRTP